MVIDTNANSGFIEGKDALNNTSFKMGFALNANNWSSGYLKMSSRLSNTNALMSDLNMYPYGISMENREGPTTIYSQYMTDSFSIDNFPSDGSGGSKFFRASVVGRETFFDHDKLHVTMMGLPRTADGLSTGDL